MRSTLLASFAGLLGLCLNKAEAQVQGPSSSQTPYVLPLKSGVITKSIITTADAVNGYTMVGTPDGLGAFDNRDGTFTLLMNHEFGNTAGVVRAHGSTGAFVSKWIIRKSDLRVMEGSDLMRNVKLWNGSGYTTYNLSNPSSLARFARFCSADLADVSAFYDAASGKGTTARIFMNGEENGNEGRGMAHIVTGAEAGTSYELPYLGKLSYENIVANPATGIKTVTAGMDDATPGQVYFYIGTKQSAGNEIEKAGLTNGTVYSPSVPGMLIETSGAVPAPNTAFTMVSLGDVHNLTGTQLNTNSNNAGVTQFLRPEDGAWDPIHPEDFYFATTNAFTSPSRLWRLHFSDINDLTKGGTITAVLDGTEGQKMLDNITIDRFGHILLVEDVGGNPHNGKVWQYDINTDQLTLLAQHDVARFGDLNTPATAPFNQDEEASGILDVQNILGAGWFLVVDQAHYALPGQLVEGGQLMAFYNPDTYASCINFNGSIGVAPSPAVAGQQANTIYLGYGPQSVTLTAAGADGVAPYSYVWSNGAVTAAITVSPLVTTDYQVAISNAYGCAINRMVTINVVDIRDGNKNKVFICHNGHEQSVSVNAVAAHLAHGDLLGNCTQARMGSFANEDAATPSVAVFPNPSNEKSTVVVTLAEAATVTIQLKSAEGALSLPQIKRNLAKGQNLVELNTSGLAAGTYFLTVQTGDKQDLLRLVITH